MRADFPPPAAGHDSSRILAVQVRWTTGDREIQVRTGGAAECWHHWILPRLKSGGSIEYRIRAGRRWEPWRRMDS